ncbi:hypothetical protein EDC01DRAFT_779195 [Geopyxis carbonaria]|nr:hypothetical protein EDC01DRAFT_779195 [Geopyxis carbonaria]
MVLVEALPGNNDGWMPSSLIVDTTTIVPAATLAPITVSTSLSSSNSGSGRSSTTTTSEDTGQIPVGVIIGLVLGISTLVLLSILGIAWWWRRRRAQHKVVEVVSRHPRRREGSMASGLSGNSRAGLVANAAAMPGRF